MRETRLPLFQSFYIHSAVHSVTQLHQSVSVNHRVHVKVALRVNNLCTAALGWMSAPGRAHISQTVGTPWARSGETIPSHPRDKNSRDEPEGGGLLILLGKRLTGSRSTNGDFQRKQTSVLLMMKTCVACTTRLNAATRCQKMMF